LLRRQFVGLKIVQGSFQNIEQDIAKCGNFSARANGAALLVAGPHLSGDAKQVGPEE
jgi:hypothetical protein